MSSSLSSLLEFTFLPEGSELGQSREITENMGVVLSLYASDRSAGSGLKCHSLSSKEASLRSMEVWPSLHQLPPPPPGGGGEESIIDGEVALNWPTPCDPHWQVAQQGDHG